MGQYARLKWIITVGIKNTLHCVDMPPAENAFCSRYGPAACNCVKAGWRWETFTCWCWCNGITIRTFTWCQKKNLRQGRENQTCRLSEAHAGPEAAAVNRKQRIDCDITLSKECIGFGNKVVKNNSIEERYHGVQWVDWVRTYWVHVRRRRTWLVNDPSTKFWSCWQRAKQRRGQDHG